MPHSAILGTQQLTDKQIIDRTHPAIIKGKPFRQDGRILPAGKVVAKDSNGELAAYEPGLANVSDWAGSTANVIGDLAVPTTPNGRYYRCVTGGTTDSSEPTWPVTAEGQVTDGTVVWEEAGLIGTDDIAGGGVLTEQIDTSVEQVGAVMVHGCVVSANLDVAEASPSESDIEALEGIGIFPI